MHAVSSMSSSCTALLSLREARCLGASGPVTVSHQPLDGCCGGRRAATPLADPLFEGTVFIPNDEVSLAAASIASMISICCTNDCMAPIPNMPDELVLFWAGRCARMSSAIYPADLCDVDLPGATHCCTHAGCPAAPELTAGAATPPPLLVAAAGLSAGISADSGHVGQSATAIFRQVPVGQLAMQLNSLTVPGAATREDVSASCWQPEDGSRRAAARAACPVSVALL